MGMLLPRLVRWMRSGGWLALLTHVMCWVAAYLVISGLVALFFSLVWEMFGIHLATPLMRFHWGYVRPFAVFAASFLVSLFRGGWITAAVMDAWIVGYEVTRFAWTPAEAVSLFGNAHFLLHTVLFAAAGVSGCFLGTWREMRGREMRGRESRRRAESNTAASKTKAGKRPPQKGRRTR